MSHFTIDGYDPIVGRRLMILIRFPRESLLKCCKASNPNGIELQLVHSGSIKGRSVDEVGEPIRDAVISNT